VGTETNIVLSEASVAIVSQACIYIVAGQQRVVLSCMMGVLTVQDSHRILTGQLLQTSL
jgi:hypothetical protein